MARARGWVSLFEVGSATGLTEAKAPSFLDNLRRISTFAVSQRRRFAQALLTRLHRLCSASPQAPLKRHSPSLRAAMMQLIVMQDP
jgi:hypothetical protein